MHDVLSTPFDRRTFRDGLDLCGRQLAGRPPRADAVFSRIPRVKSTLPKEDWEFVHRFAKRHLVDHVPEPTVRYLVNEDSYYTSWNPSD